MKRSEAIIVRNQREIWGTTYTAVSIKQDDDGNDGEAYFCHSGCDICSDLPCGGAGDVFDVVYLSAEDVARKVFDNVYDGQLCGACLCSVINGDDSDLDFSVTEEDAK